MDELSHEEEKNNTQGEGDGDSRNENVLWVLDGSALALDRDVEGIVEE